MDQLMRYAAFGGAIAAGVLCIYFGIHDRRPALYAFAAVAFFGGITGFIYAASAQPTGSIDPPKVGGKFLGLPDWLLIVDGLLIVGAVILAFVLR